MEQKLTKQEVWDEFRKPLREDRVCFNCKHGERMKFHEPDGTTVDTNMWHCGEQYDQKSLMSFGLGDPYLNGMCKEHLLYSFYGYEDYIDADVESMWEWDGTTK